MADVTKSLDVLIRTRAELQGAQDAALQMERNIGKAKVLGKDTTELEARLKALKVTLDAARQALSEKAVEMTRVTSAAAKYKQELAELEQQVKNLDAREAFVKNVAPQELDQSAERTRRMSDATSTFTDLLNQEDAAQKELSGTVRTYTEKDLEELFKKTEKTTNTKKLLKDATKGLSLEFPVLGHLARLALNPITFLVAAAASAFVIWRHRVKELQQSLNSLELPDISPPDPHKINASTTAWNQMAEAVNKSKGAFASAEEVYNRAVEKIDRIAGAQRKLLEANKGLELSGAKTPEERARIEARYAAAGLSVDEKTERQKLARKEELKFNLETEADVKRRQADSIRIASPETDAKTLADLKSQAEAAQKDMESTRSRIKDIVSAREDGTFERLKLTPKLYSRYGPSMTGSEALEIEQRKLSEDQSIIDRFNKRQQQQEERDRRRKQREQLYGEAESAAGRAAQIGLELPGDREAVNFDQRVNRRVSLVEDAQRLTEVKEEADQKAKDLALQAINALQSNGTITGQMAQAIKQNRAELEALKRDFANLNARRNADVR